MSEVGRAPGTTLPDTVDREELWRSDRLRSAGGQTVEPLPPLTIVHVAMQSRERRASLSQHERRVLGNVLGLSEDQDAWLAQQLSNTSWLRSRCPRGRTTGD